VVHLIGSRSGKAGPPDFTRLRLAARSACEFGIALAALSSIAACPDPRPKEPILFGVVGSLTGPRASYGVSARNGIDLAVREQNDAGGVGGRMVRAIHIDAQGDPELSREAVRRLIVQDQVDLLIGDAASAAVLAMAEVAQRAKTPLLVPSATHPRITEVGDHVFRSCFADPLQADVMARFAREELRVSRVSVFADLGSEYSLTLADAFAKRFGDLGGAARSAHYQSDDETFEAIFGEATGAEAIYVPGYDRDVLRIAGERKKRGLQAVLLGADGWDTNDLAASEALDGSYFTTHYTALDPRPEVKRFVDAYVRAMNEVPDSHAALGYDAARYGMAALAASRGSPATTLGTLSGFVGVTGPIALDGHRNPRKPVVVLKLSNADRTLARVYP
jgi:branched-chain amino acid transport system substrate-binding protein